MSYHIAWELKAVFRNCTRPGNSGTENIYNISIYVMSLGGFWLYRDKIYLIHTRKAL